MFAPPGCWYQDGPLPRLFAAPRSILVSDIAEVLAALHWPGAAAWSQPLHLAMTDHAINTRQRVSAFLATLTIESNQGRHQEEGLNYAASALPKLFSAFRGEAGQRLAGELGRQEAACADVEHEKREERYRGRGKSRTCYLITQRADQEGIANHAYGKNKGLGNTRQGDGWRFRGRGLLQITGRANYLEVAKHFGLVSSADDDTWVTAVTAFLLSPEGSAKAAAWHWQTHRCNEAADSGDIAQWRRLINSGMAGLAEVTAAYHVAIKVFASLTK